MSILILGLILFLGLHSLRIVADGWRARTIARIGPNTWKGLYSLLSILGFALIVWGFGQARLQPWPLWQPAPGLRHAVALLTLPAFILLVAAYVPNNLIKARLRHPMILGVLLWALAHLLCNGMLAEVLLFASFALWAVLGLRAARQRDRIAATPRPTGGIAGTAIAVLIGTVAWAAFAYKGHVWLIGVPAL